MDDTANTSPISPDAIVQQMRQDALRHVKLATAITERDGTTQIIFVMDTQPARFGRERAHPAVANQLQRLLHEKGIETVGGVSPYRQVGEGQWGMAVKILPASFPKALTFETELSHLIADANSAPAPGGRAA